MDNNADGANLGEETSSSAQPATKMETSDTIKKAVENDVTENSNNGAGTAAKDDDSSNPQKQEKDSTENPSDENDVTENSGAGTAAKDDDSSNPQKPDTESTEKPSDGDDERAWDTTVRKVIINNILKYMKPKEISKLVSSWLEKLPNPGSISIVKMKKPPMSNWVQITLEKDEMVQPFLDLINNNRFMNKRGQPLYAKRVDPNTDTRDGSSKRKHAGGENGRDGKRAKQQEQGTDRPKTADEVRDAITPMWRESYETQLQKKCQELVRRCALKIVQEVKQKFRLIEKEARKNKHRKSVKVYDWISQRRAIEVAAVLPSPKTMEYRNKCEFTFGYRHNLSTASAEEVTSADEIKKIPAVGFLASGWSGGVSRPHCCQNIPPEACAIAGILDEFLQSSPIPPYNSREHRGLWRTIAIRTSNRTGECMIVIVHAPPAGGLGAKEDEDYSAVFVSERERLVEMLTDKELVAPQRDYPEAVKDTATDSSGNDESKATPPDTSTPIRVTSIFFQEYDGVSMPKPEHPVQHAFGKLALQEKLGKCTFQISPGAFFQVNTECAEVLYNVVVEKVREVATKPEETLLIDVCCGTGTIGITCMKEGVVGRIVGVDISQPAIEDAKINAELNGFSKHGDSEDPTKFVASRAELVLGHELDNLKNSSHSIVAVVDPAREGLHADVVRAIRAAGKIKRLVYVSCNPTATLVRDAALLCSPPTKKYPGCPFKPISAQPVDMFPLTPHCEMVMTFDRIEQQN